MAGAAYPLYRTGAYGATIEDDNANLVDRRDIADDLDEVLRVFYATASLTEESVGAAERLNTLIDRRD